MTKLLALFSIMSVGFLLAMSRLSPNGIYMLFASSSMQMNYLRIGMIALILIYLLLNRHAYLIVKFFLVLATAVIVAELVSIENHQGLGVLDIMSFAMSGVTVLLLTIETKAFRRKETTEVTIRKPNLEHRYGAHQVHH